MRSRFVFIGFVFISFWISGCKELRPVTETTRKTAIEFEDPAALLKLFKCDSLNHVVLLENEDLRNALKASTIWDDVKFDDACKADSGKIVKNPDNKKTEPKKSFKAIITDEITTKEKPCEPIIKEVSAKNSVSKFILYLSLVGNIVQAFAFAILFVLFYQMSKKLKM